MYTPRLFREDDVRRLHQLIEDHAFGTLVATADDGVEIAHVPFVLDREDGPHGTLRFHVARANAIARLAALRPLVAVFQGPHGYVSASWYEKPHDQVPTWNYAVVHAHGRARELTDEGTRALLADLATANEGPQPAWRFADVDAVFAAERLREIAAFALPIERLEGKFKLSQNRTPEDRERVKRAFAARATPDDLAMLDLMR
jgi:transcriptional regulator